METDRIAKRIAHLGYCSRRNAERLIFAGEVKVNGVIIKTPAFLVSKADKIVVENIELKPHIKTMLYAYYKPVGVVCSAMDEKGRETIYDKLNQISKTLPRLVYVGRLDINSEGLLLLTNSPHLSTKLTSQTESLKRVYKVRAYGKISQNDLEKLAMGITIEGINYKPIIANLLSSKNSNCWIEFAITEGKNKEIRRICEYLNLQVNRLIRVSFGPYKLEDMREGELRELDIKHIEKLIK